MALSGTERQRKRRERIKNALKAAPDAADEFIGSGFSDFFESEDARQERLFIRETLDSVGLLPNADLGLDKNVDPQWEEHDWGTPNRGSLGRAERMVDAMIDTAKALAEIINRYKLREIDAAIAKLEATKLTNAAARKQALQDAVRLNAIRTRLTKEVRHSFPQHTVKGE